MIRLPIIIIGTLIALLLFGYLNQHRGKTTITIEIIIIILSSLSASLVVILASFIAFLLGYHD